MSLSPPPLLELSHISLSFKGVKAITDISFAVARGEICALIGPNGAGKSSMLNVINGAGTCAATTPPSAGWPAPSRTSRCSRV